MKVEEMVEEKERLARMIQEMSDEEKEELRKKIAGGKLVCSIFGLSFDEKLCKFIERRLG